MKNRSTKNSSEGLEVDMRVAKKTRKTTSSDRPFLLLCTGGSASSPLKFSMTRTIVTSVRMANMRQMNNCFFTDNMFVTKIEEKKTD